METIPTLSTKTQNLRQFHLSRVTSDFRPHAPFTVPGQQPIVLQYSRTLMSSDNLLLLPWHRHTHIRELMSGKESAISVYKDGNTWPSAPSLLFRLSWCLCMCPTNPRRWTGSYPNLGNPICKHRPLLSPSCPPCPVTKPNPHGLCSVISCVHDSSHLFKDTKELKP